MPNTNKNNTVLAMCVQEIREDGSEISINEIIRSEDVEFLHHAFIADTIVNILDIPSTDFRLYYPKSAKSSKRINTITDYLNGKLKGKKKNKLHNGLEILPIKVERWGLKMERVFCDCFDQGYKHVLFIGSRTPTLKADRLELALRLLKKSDAVFGPTIEGRYYLLGMSDSYHVRLSEFDWKSPTIYSEVSEKFREKGLSWSEMEIWYAVENHDALEFLIRDINQYRLEGDEISAKETEMVLQRILNR
jgi:glycosyltransferase A (GT-A) superfamily protein (DUF2064 family)